MSYVTCNTVITIEEEQIHPTNDILPTPYETTFNGVINIKSVKIKKKTN